MVKENAEPTRRSLTFEPLIPNLDLLTFDRLVIYYDREADVLLVHFDGPRSAVMLDIDDHLSLSIDPASHAVVGLQIEAYLLAAVFKQPRLLDLAAVAGIPDDEINAIRSRIAPAVVAQATIRSLLADLLPRTA